MSNRIEPIALPQVAALYLRVSSKRQGEDDKASLPTQRAALDALAAELGYATDEAYVYEDQYSGEELHQRPALSRLRADAHRHRFAIVLAYNVYALAKNQAHMAILLDEWEQIGVKLQFATETLENTPVGRLMLNARTFAAEVEGERRKDRLLRALSKRVADGRPATGVRANYGYQWADERDTRGRLTKAHQERNPQTWPTLQRIWRDALAGGALRGIADALTREGIPTSQGAARWDASTIRGILTNPLYWGRPMALRRRRVAVDPSVHKYYAHKSRAVPRPVEEQVPLPADYAPAVVSPEEAAWVMRRLRLNQELSAPNATAAAEEDEPLVLLRGLAHCGYCGGRLRVMRVPTQRKDASKRVVYRCRKGQRSSLACGSHSIEAQKLDTAVWQRVSALLADPDLIAQEIERLHATPSAQQQTLAAIERQLSDLRRRISNKRKYAEMVEDDRERAEVAAEVTLLRRQERAFEAEAVAAGAQERDEQAQLEALRRLRATCAQVAQRLDQFTAAQRRQALFALRADVRLYRAEHDPRADLTIHLPYAGALSAQLLSLAQDTKAGEKAAAGDDADDAAPYDQVGSMMCRASASRRPKRPAATFRSSAVAAAPAPRRD